MGRIINEDEKQENKTQPNMTDIVKYVEEKVRISVKNETVSGQDVNGNIEANNKEKCITQIGIQCQNTTVKTGNNSLDQYIVTILDREFHFSIPVCHNHELRISPSCPRPYRLTSCHHFLHTQIDYFNKTIHITYHMTHINPYLALFN